jgi:hypothetical protein
MANGCRFFTVARRRRHWWSVTPDGEPLFSIGMNHIDSASLRYPENVHIWRERCGNDQKRWPQGRVASDLKDWGFNTIGWRQEVVIRAETIHRHTRRLTYEEYQWLDMPYCRLLPHQGSIAKPAIEVDTATALSIHSHTAGVSACAPDYHLLK